MQKPVLLCYCLTLFPRKFNCVSGTKKLFFPGEIFDKDFLRPSRSTALEYCFCKKANFSIILSILWGSVGCDGDGSISLMNQSRPPVFRILPFFEGNSAAGCCDNRGLNPRGCNRKLCSVSWEGVCGVCVWGRAGFFNGSSIPKMSSLIMAAGGGGGGYSFAGNKFA